MDARTVTKIYSKDWARKMPNRIKLQLPIGCC